MDKTQLLKLAKKFGLDKEVQYLLSKNESVDSILKEWDLNGPSHSGTLITKKDNNAETISIQDC